jgi:carbamoyl-phosphate synthase small subunit
MARMARNSKTSPKKAAYLVLENGCVFEGETFGKTAEVTGEVVFTTGMGGYLETITDPSYYGQIIVQTFPLIGNYGVIPADLESTENPKISAKAYIVKHLCQEPSNFRSEGSLDIFLEEQGIVGLSGIDTRALAKIIRDNGVMNGKICTAKPTDADIADAKACKIENVVAAWQPRNSLKKAIAGHNIGIFAYGTSADKLLAEKHKGIVLADGAGNPADTQFAPVIEEIKKLVKSGVPILGIGLGHQLLAIANGYKTEPLPFGHRGSNQPVKDLSTGRVYMSSQNHGYTVVADKSDKNIAFVNVNDGTCEGLDYGANGGKSMSVQFYPCGHSADTAFVMDRFIERLGG